MLDERQVRLHYTLGYNTKELARMFNTTETEIRAIIDKQIEEENKWAVENANIIQRLERTLPQIDFQLSYMERKLFAILNNLQMLEKEKDGSYSTDGIKKILPVTDMILKVINERMKIRNINPDTLAEYDNLKSNKLIRETIAKIVKALKRKGIKIDEGLLWQEVEGGEEDLEKIEQET